MAGASAGRTSSKSSGRFSNLRTASISKKGVVGSRFAKKSEVANHRKANDAMAKTFKNSLAQLNRNKS